MTSIFTIERRKDFSQAFTRFFEDLQTEISTTAGSEYKIFDYLNRCIRYWPHRCGAAGIDDYLKSIDVDISSPKEDKDLLLTLELIINLLHWAPKQDELDDRNSEWSISFKKNDVRNESARLLENAGYLLEECCNMQVRKQADLAFPKYRITKRNVNVDAAVAATPDLSEVLLGYFDIRNQDDIEYKKAALTAIYAHMEPLRKAYRSLSCSSVSEEFFTSMNTFGIRHNTQSQVRLSHKKKISVCDKLFMMAVYVLQTDDVNGYKNELKDLRESQDRQSV